jgi:predicted DNA-binding protein (MmcQ/YjbR family)
VSDISYEILREQPGLRPAPYFATRGLKWIQHYTKPGLPDDALGDYLRASHRIVARGLSRKKRDELGLGRPQRNLRCWRYSLSQLRTGVAPPARMAFM